LNLANPKILISILNWNNFSGTKACIQSVLAQEYTDFTILLLDNASSDDSFVRLQQEFPLVETMALPTNNGYAAAHKISAQKAIKEHFDAVWILNNDLIVQTDTLARLTDSWKRNGLAVFGSVSLVMDGNDTIDFGGGWELSKNGGLDYALPYNQYRGKTISEVGSKLAERVVSDVNGCSMLIPSEIIDKHGFMDESFFLYKEETDFCFTLMERGIPSILVPGSKVYHALGGSFFNHKLKLFKTYYSERNLVVFMQKHPRYFVPFRNPVKKYKPSFEAIIEMVRFILSGKRKTESYYKHLGILHAQLGIRGKYFSPEKYL